MDTDAHIIFYVCEYLTGDIDNDIDGIIFCNGCNCGTDREPLPLVYKFLENDPFERGSYCFFLQFELETLDFRFQ